MTAIAPSQATAPLVLTIDVGTSSVRALLFDALARTVEGVAAQEGYSVRSTEDGISEIDPTAMLERVVRCIDAALAQAGPLVDAIGAVALDTLVTSFLAIDAEHQPITPIITYADTRASAQSEQLRRELDERVAQERTGCMLRASYWAPRLAWFRQHEPTIWRSAARWITLGEYLELQLFGQGRVSYSAAAWTGLLDRRTLTWDAPLLEYLGETPERLGELVDLDAPIQGLRSPYRERWPKLSSVPWFPAIGDGAAANIGSGCIGHERMALTVGTTGAIRVAQPTVESVPFGLWCYRVDRHLALLGGATTEGGNVYAWLRDTFRLGDAATIERELASLPPAAHGLTILPLLAGERSPGWAGNAKATISGLTLATTPIQVMQASLEAVTYRFAQIEELMCGDPNCGHRLIASGGALLSSPTWMQMIADALGRPVVASAETEATSRGVALLALRSVGALRSLADAPAADGAQYEPRPALRERYREAIEQQKHLYNLLIARQAG
jgi:gluconokinase